jgi:hypothetical protein
VATTGAGGNRFAFAYTKCKPKGITGLTLALSSCSIYQAQPAVNLNSLAQARTRSAGPVRITAAVLSAKESRRFFGVPIYESGVQQDQRLSELLFQGDPRTFGTEAKIQACVRRHHLD